MKRVTLMPQQIEAPVPVQVPVHNFEPPAAVPPTSPTLDPAFAIGPAAAIPPPSPVPPPEGYQGFMAAALAARNSSPSYANFWASMAQATATAEVADQLERLNTFLGVEDVLPDGNGPVRLFDVLADALSAARNDEDEEEEQKPAKKTKK